MQHPARNFDGQRHDLHLLVDFVSEIAVAEELQHGEGADEIEKAVSQPDVQELRAAGQEADHREQHDRERADASCLRVRGRKPLAP